MRPFNLKNFFQHFSPCERAKLLAAARWWIQTTDCPGKFTPQSAIGYLLQVLGLKVLRNSAEEAVGFYLKEPGLQSFDLTATGIGRFTPDQAQQRFEFIERG